MKNYKKIAAWVGLITTVMLVVGALVAYKVILDGCAPYIEMIVGSYDMTDQAIYDITSALKVAWPILIVVWSVFVGFDVWKVLVFGRDEES